ncbi:hypothetical protein [Sphingobium sp. CECT 9361]|uniref:hypothetical protein n=1 Tax=Sphingobium sp. CECT 9361 TaxID=2845384 RepID=UPI001E5BDA5C|nr:hypothetical protein [Sphingobium sp. CECT 9361]CAH0354388.1 hypothetical protein SPH9361_02999 [Sphingobium sp. CECT 9361]
MVEPAALDPEIFPPENAIAASATTDRARLARGYYVIVTPKTKKALGLGRWAALVFVHPVLAHIDDDRKMRDYLAIHCRVRVDRRMPDELGKVCLDQTLRNALGIPFGLFPALKPELPLFLFPASRTWSATLRLIVASVFGLRFLAARSAPAAVADIEKGYVRLPDDLLSVIGALPADDVVVERPIAVGGPKLTKFRIISEKLSTAIASKGFLDDRRDRSGSGQLAPPAKSSLLDRFRMASPPTHLPLNLRYPRTKDLLYDYKTFADAGMIEPNVVTGLAALEVTETDVPSIFMDRDARTKGINPDRPAEAADYLTPFMVRRSILSAAARDSLGTAFAVTISLIQFPLIFVANKAGISVCQWIAGVTVALIVSLALMIARLRQQI